MRIDFSKLFHHSSKDASWGGAVNIPSDSGQWPDEWKTVYYKTYPRLPSVTLPPFAVPQIALSAALLSRATRRDFSGAPFPFADLSALLEGAFGLAAGRGDSRRAYPSGGARFPVEVYALVIKGTEELPSGVYHYNPKSHDLSVLWMREFTEENIRAVTPYEWARDASTILVFTALFNRTSRKYGERGYRYVLLEAGHMGQNAYLIAGALGRKCCALGGVRDDELERILDIDGVTESVVYALALGV